MKCIDQSNSYRVWITLPEVINRLKTDRPLTRTRQGYFFASSFSIVSRKIVHVCIGLLIHFGWIWSVANKRLSTNWSNKTKWLRKHFYSCFCTPLHFWMFDLLWTWSLLHPQFFKISFSLSTFSSIGEQNVPLVKSESFDAEDYKSIELIGKNDVWIMLGKTDEVSWLVTLEIFEVFLMTFCYT